jgi:hypothetical protein
VDPEPILIGVDHLQRTQATRIFTEQAVSPHTKSISHSRVDQCVERPLLIISERVPRANLASISAATVTTTSAAAASVAVAPVEPRRRLNVICRIDGHTKRFVRIGARTKNFIDGRRLRRRRCGGCWGGSCSGSACRRRRLGGGRLFSC